MIVAVGVDVTEHAAIAAALADHGAAFLNVVFTKEEAHEARGQRSPERYLSGVFSVKEAAMKALGRGLLNGVWFTDVEVLGAPRGPIRVSWRRRALDRYRELGEPVLQAALAQDRRRSVAPITLEQAG
jgi:holo-[acyl-carrier protein] synthase